MILCVAVCCSVLQYKNLVFKRRIGRATAVWDDLVCCSVLQCVAV